MDVGRFFARTLVEWTIKEMRYSLEKQLVVTKLHAIFVICDFPNFTLFNEIFLTKINGYLLYQTSIREFKKRKFPYTEDNIYEKLITFCGNMSLK